MIVHPLRSPYPGMDRPSHTPGTVYATSHECCCFLFPMKCRSNPQPSRSLGALCAQSGDIKLAHCRFRIVRQQYHGYGVLTPNAFLMLGSCRGNPEGKTSDFLRCILQDEPSTHISSTHLYLCGFRCFMYCFILRVPRYCA